MAKATGKRGQRTKADDALSRKATQHHDFVGQADRDREQSRAVEEKRIRRDQKELEKEVVQEMAQELEQISGVAEPPRPHPEPERPPAQGPPQAPPFEIPTSLREGIELLRQRGPEALEALRRKAEERLEQMPAPVRGAVRLTERAFGLALWPVRAGAHLVGCMLETPVALIRILIARRTA
ncbi:MAG: hypothetical protein ACJ79H_21200 [Myxococcales bacterium]